MLKITLVALIGVMSVGIFKEFKVEYALPMSIATILCIIGLLIPDMIAVIDTVNRFFDDNSFDSEILSDILKLVGISIIRNFGYNLCVDCGSKSVADKIDFGSRISSILIILPKLTELYVNIIKLL